MTTGPGPSSGTGQLRRANTAVVLQSLRRRGPASRAELAQRTGLAKATVGAIVADLEEAGAVVEEAPAQPARGRPSRPVALRPGAHLGLGLELNVDYVSAVVVDLAGAVLASESRAAGEDRVEVLLALAAELRATHPGPLLGATVAVPALVRDDDRTVAWAPNLPLHGDGLVAHLAAALGCEVRVVNDANCAAYAEAHHGAARGVDHALYLTGTVGIGAGIVVGGQLVQGAAGFAGEVGHMPVGDPTAPCGCGRRGCWEASIGLHAVLEAVGMPELDTPVTTAEAVAARAADDPAARATVERVGRDLGLGLAILSGVLDPAVVVLGGYFVPLGDLVLEPARRVLDARLASEVQVRPELRLGTLGLRAAALGAAEQSLARVLAGEADLADLGDLGDLAVRG
ncbi:ROK family transcriptional regulator [Nocardioides marmotae]|uniref:ROK family transcriptional regulator n=1 Tax=Nocardioides marmotae TaxID=2663857 RepID=UPI0014955A1E|nr:ROK family transcriptional regulator [Nocardioides marmotae]QKD99928.1 ROK family transcriptional regulator [Nocardioides marmotae]